MKNIIKTSVLAVVMLLLCGVSQAQDATTQRKTREQLAEAQAKHIAKELALDKSTAKKYVDTYCRYQQDVWTMYSKISEPRETSSEQKSDAEVEQELQKRFEHSQKILSLRQKYYAEYSQFLTQNQIKRAYELEKQAMNRLFKNKRTAHKKK